MSVSVRWPAPPVSALVAEHLLRGAALLLRGGWLALDGPACLLAMILDLLTLLSTLHHGGDLAAFSRWYRPPGQSRGLQLVAHGIDQSGDIDEVGDWLGCGASAGAHCLWDEFGRSVVEHGGAADGVEGDGEDGVVQGEGPVASGQVTHCHRLQAGELGGGVAGDRRDGDVGQPHRTVGWGGWWSAGVGQDHHLKIPDK